MAETKRTLSTVLLNLADNTTQQISPEDIRDAIVTATIDHGDIYIVGQSETSIPVINTWYTVAGTWSLSMGLDWAMDVNGQLKYTGPAARMCHAGVSLSFTTDSGNQVLKWGVARNGLIIPASIQSVKNGGGSDISSTALHLMVNMATDDYLTLEVQNTTSATGVTVEFGNMFAVGSAI
mgnify:FL=1